MKLGQFVKIRSIFKVEKIHWYNEKGMIVEKLGDKCKIFWIKDKTKSIPEWWDSTHLELV